MLKDGHDTFVEIGPHPVLVAGSEALFQQRQADVVISPSMTRREPEVIVFLHSLARLAASVTISRRPVSLSASCGKVTLRVAS